MCIIELRFSFNKPLQMENRCLWVHDSFRTTMSWVLSWDRTIFNWIMSLGKNWCQIHLSTPLMILILVNNDCNKSEWSIRTWFKGTRTAHAWLRRKWFRIGLHLCKTNNSRWTRIFKEFSLRWPTRAWLDSQLSKLNSSNSLRRHTPSLHRLIRANLWLGRLRWEFLKSLS